MSTFEAMRSEPLKSIPETFAGVDVFITGGSGFMGKVLIEKLLRSCPDIGQVFVLLREKKGKSSGERVQELVKIPVGRRDIVVHRGNYLMTCALNVFSCSTRYAKHIQIVSRR